MRLDLSALIAPELELLVPQTREFYVGRPAGRGPTGPEDLRRTRAAVPTPVAVDPPPTVETVRMEGREVAVRIHRPAAPPRAVLLDIHGGGFFLGSAAAGDRAARRLVDALGVAVVSVDYRLAPEHPWPAGPDDVETAALWLAEHAATRFGTTRLAMTGFSAGATLAVAALVRLRDRGITAYDAAVLQFGTWDLAAATPAGRLIADEYFLQAYAGTAADRTHPDISPLFADLRDLPPLLLVVGREDVLLEDNLAMAARLCAAGVAVDLRVYPASPHGFTGHATPMARAALGHLDAWLAGHLGC
ncbi:alpha/beta hydrolase [Tersicoccus sp. Bi-70]|uniref:alpha/beta hydrolase n=1 Tax=Tersicoccus sp. Bi-70 TaxID=1897634 RepID=UPI00097858BA|nr:alpha/beta hydrolase fold domain-containing protein [Tersicoccus sp. Bi-70]OMH35131.1 esterase [Tersicoccus sp. Bi-70]